VALLQCVMAKDTLPIRRVLLAVLVSIEEMAGSSGLRGLTKRWSRLAIASCGMVKLLAASCSTCSFAR